MRWPWVNRRKMAAQLQQYSDGYRRLQPADMAFQVAERPEYWWGVVDGFGSAAQVIRGENNG